MQLIEVKEKVEKLSENIKKVIIGKDDTIRLMIAAMFAGGHILLEDVPGSGKTMLAKTLAKSVDGDFKRIQMTPDLLPSDITGINYFDMKTNEFRFIKGPAFTNILIADEINRANPKTQSGLLECMEERQITVDGSTYKLDDVFMVVATENPVDSQGVFKLPEAQLDRFLMKLYMEYPSHEDMTKILKVHTESEVLDDIKPVMTIDEIKEIAKMVKNVKVDECLYEYVANIVERTRNHEDVILGISQRGGIALVKAAKSVALMSGRDYVIPDDIKACAPEVLSHRMLLKNSQRIRKNGEKEVILSILDEVEVPTEPI
ncbi:MAG: MoxR family ATPase [Lachnospiraceae bacterium]|nr:MoxR family ATPase [Lachnospiraceae bacterium]